jgi:hemerythrin-like domain-containing protein
MSYIKKCKTKIAEYYRHYIQHLRQELTKRDLNLFPVWRTLSWVDPEDSNNTYIEVIGSRIKNTNYPDCTYDTKNRKWIST